MWVPSAAAVVPLPHARDRSSWACRSTTSPVKIPGAAYEADSPQTGRLRLGDAQIRLHSQLGA